MGIFDKLKKKLNGEQNSQHNEIEELAINQEEFTEETNLEKEEDSETTRIVEEKVEDDVEILSIKPKEIQMLPEPTEEQVKVREYAQNIEELEELTMVKIEKLLANFRFSDVQIQTVRFHLRKTRTDVYSVRAEKRFTAEGFLENLKSKLERDNVKYAQNLNVELVFKSPYIDDYTKITQQVSVEVLTPKDVFKQQRASIKALTGKTYKDIYILTSEYEKPYFIGRGKTPQLPSGRIISNNIAFIEPETDSDEQIVQNRYVSRSILLIAYNQDINKFEIGRTNLMFDSNHIVKINRLQNNGEQKEIKLNTPQIRVPLEDGDMIIINQKINLLFELIDK